MYAVLTVHSPSGWLAGWLAVAGWLYIFSWCMVHVMLFTVHEQTQLHNLSSHVPMNTCLGTCTCIVYCSSVVCGYNQDDDCMFGGSSSSSSSSSSSNSSDTNLLLCVVCVCVWSHTLCMWAAFGQLSWAIFYCGNINSNGCCLLQSNTLLQI